tara:strand:- start:482 stop:1543 length:1062 start_codon:yes stop_codon:yes gene_type:complete
MADRNGYIGRAPGDSSVTVARQVFSPTGVQTNFTFASGYVPGYLDVYLNGAKLIVAQDFTATDGSVVGLTSFAQSGDVVEAVAFKAFNATSVNSAGTLSVSGNQTNDGTLSVTGGTTLSNLIVTGITTLSAGSSVSFATTAFNISGSPDITVTNISSGIITASTFSGGEVNGSDANFTGILTAASASFSGNVSIGGTLTYEDVTNIDSVGIVTARTGVRVTAGGLVVTAGIATLGAGLTMGDNDKAYFGDAGDLQIYHDGSNSFIKDVGTGILQLNTNYFQVKNAADDEFIIQASQNGAVSLRFDNSEKFATTNTGAIVTGILTATSFEGSGENLTNLPASGDANDITASLFT